MERLATWVETVEPKETQPEFGPDLVIRWREAQWSEFQRFRQQAEERLRVQRQEAEEWQGVRDAFETRHATRRRRNLRPSEEDLGGLAEN
jgi:alpha-glucuronidase